MRRALLRSLVPYDVADQASVGEREWSPVVLGRGARWLMAVTVEATVAGLLTYLIRDPLTGERLTLTRTEHTGFFSPGSSRSG